MRNNYSFSILNVAANPHPDGTYSTLLENVAGKAIEYWGSDYATISKPLKIDNGIYQGRVVIWTQIDPEEPAIDLRQLEEIPLDETDYVPPSNIGFNGRIFIYTLKEDNHLLFCETENEFGKKFAPNRAKRVFSRLLSAENLPADSPIVEITVVPDDDSIKRLLGIHRIDRVRIHLKKPNPDDFGEIAQEVLNGLETRGAKSQDLEYARASDAESINLTEDDTNLANVASENGYVETKGVEEDGSKFEGSTLEHPKILRIAAEAADSVAAAARRIAETYVSPFR